MPNGTDTHKLTYNDWILNVHHATQEPARFMLLLHGWTGDENSMWIFANGCPDDMWIAAPRAPYSVEEGGYSWREIQPGNWGLPTLSDLKPAADNLIRLVDGFSVSVGVDATQFDVTGFSQGGALANILTLLYPHRIHKAAVLAGFMPGGVDELLAQRVLADKPFFVAHGTQDNLIPVERAQQSIELLEHAGAVVSFCESEVGHKVGADCLQSLKVFWENA